MFGDVITTKLYSPCLYGGSGYSMALGKIGKIPRMDWSPGVLVALSCR